MSKYPKLDNLINTVCTKYEDVPANILYHYFNEFFEWDKALTLKNMSADYVDQYFLNLRDIILSLNEDKESYSEEEFPRMFLALYVMLSSIYRNDDGKYNGDFIEYDKFLSVLKENTVEELLDIAQIEEKYKQNFKDFFSMNAMDYVRKYYLDETNAEFIRKAYNVDFEAEFLAQWNNAYKNTYLVSKEEE